MLVKRSEGLQGWPSDQIRPRESRPEPRTKGLHPGPCARIGRCCCRAQRGESPETALQLARGRTVAEARYDLHAIQVISHLRVPHSGATRPTVATRVALLVDAHARSASQRCRGGHRASTHCWSSLRDQRRRRPIRTACGTKPRVSLPRNVLRAIPRQAAAAAASRSNASLTRACLPNWLAPSATASSRTSWLILRTPSRASRTQPDRKKSHPPVAARAYARDFLRISAAVVEFSRLPMAYGVWTTPTAYSTTSSAASSKTRFASAGHVCCSRRTSPRSSGSRREALRRRCPGASTDA